MANIIEDVLNYLEVKHTKYFVNKLFNEHPHNNNMYGLKDMLRAYNIESKGIDIQNKDEAQMCFPAICHVGNNFVIAVGGNGKEISLWANGRIVKREVETFRRAWDGKTLIITSTENAEEQHYRHNKNLEWVTKLSFCSLFVCPLILLSVLFFYNPVVANTPAFILYIVGCVLCYLLIHKNMKEDNNIGEAFCSMITEKGCDAVLESQGSTILYIYSWSEIGLAYFVTHLMIISIAPQFMSGLVLVNYIAMAYGIWSVWYQAVKIKKWCTLCLSVQFAIWILGIYYSLLLYNGILNLANVMVSLSVVVFSVILVTVITHYAIKSFHDDDIITSIQQKLKKFQVDNDVLVAKYIKEDKISDVTNKSSLFWGDLNAKHQITIVLNPHCGHCKKIYNKMESLLQKDNIQLGIRFVFLSFGAEFDETCKFLIAAYQQMEKKKALGVYSLWFNNSAQNIETLIQTSELTVNNDSVVQEYERHKQWTSANNIRRTPYILINGHVLPSLYKIEDLEMMDEI